MVKRVMIVEDSPVMRDYLSYLIGSDPRLEVAGCAGSGEEALQILKECNPDIITMDLHLPGMNGFETTRRIMEAFPKPILIVTAADDFRQTATSFELIEMGALDVVQKPPATDHPDQPRSTRDFLDKIKALAEVPVIRRRRRGSLPAAGAGAHDTPSRAGLSRLVAIGASTGGPAALKELLSPLRPSFPVPIVIVQHMNEGFLEGFACWLNQQSAIPVTLAEDRKQLLPGRVYLAPGDRHLKVDEGGRSFLTLDPPEYYQRPSISYLFRSVAQAFGRSAIAVLLTGMGSDGARELLQLRMTGAATLAQDEGSCIVYGMPRLAAECGAAAHILPPRRIGEMLLHLTRAE